jgi:hypothetical protein
MARPYGGRPTCETCQWIDVRRWRREGRLNPGETFPWSWTIGGKPYGTINVQIEPNAVLLRFRARSYESAEWKLVEQHVPIVWTACHLAVAAPGSAALRPRMASIADAAWQKSCILEEVLCSLAGIATD